MVVQGFAESCIFNALAKAVFVYSLSGVTLTLRWSLAASLA